ncbi:MAG: ABC transporter permease [Streptosporangiales bacterium]|nr:ABC transporter permease [Streptosporangiales bacterium]
MTTPSQAPAEQVPEEALIVHRVVEPPSARRQRLVTGAVLVVVGALVTALFGVSSESGFDAAFRLSSRTDLFQVPDLVLPARPTAILLGVVIIALGGWQLVRGFPKRATKWVALAAVFGFVLSFLCWAATGDPDARLDLLSLLQQSIFLGTPLLLGAMAGVLCERSGVINIAIEGQMLTGAFLGALVASMAQNLGAGVLAAVFGGGLMGALLAVFSIRYLVNQIVVGVVLNVLALGLTGFAYDTFMKNQAAKYNEPGFFGQIKIPLLGDLPLLGPLLFQANVIVYATYVLLVVLQLALFRTRWGLRTRAVGEHPKAADTVGINVLFVRYRNVILGGMVAGLAGAYLTIGTVGAFSKDISSGKGFIALAALIFGRWSPVGALGAALLFGFADGLQTVLSYTQTPVPIPSSFLAMLPYIATLLAVAGLVGRVQAPAADGQPYTKD